MAARIMADLLVDHAIFTTVTDSSNLIQLNGVPMSDLELIQTPLVSAVNQHAPSDVHARQAPMKRGYSDIRFVRSRMLYARPAGTASGGIRIGLNPTHVLNRCRNIDDQEETCHVMKYLFPAQFGFHNVFGSPVTSTDSAQPFKDYTIREQEIARQRQLRVVKLREAGKRQNQLHTPNPRRLRGKLHELVCRLRKRHFTCAYGALLEHYCPQAANDTTGGKSSLQQASPTSRVSAFCRAVFSQTLPSELWGAGETRNHNVRIVHHNIDLFIRLRRYESLSLHDVLQGMRLTDIEWLCPPGIAKVKKLSQTDLTKRRELMAELLYWVFDSFLIPLIRGTFHVTESNVQRNQLFYFRQDVWKRMSEPALASLRMSMLEEQDTTVVKDAMKTRSLGVSHVRLLPKENGMRPIINLRRRTQKLYKGQPVLGKSVNSILTPAFSVLNYERQSRPHLLGSALFSVGDMFPRLQRYRHLLQRQGLLGKPLYFAKVDVQACFDTIPQKRLLRLISNIVDADQYHVAKYSRAKLLGSHNKETQGFGAKPSWRFLTKANAGRALFDFNAEVEADTAEGRSRTTYINGIVQRRETRQELLDLLTEHIESNLIKVGRRFYRQKEGIPQGSIVSGLLCSYFYAELEREVLGFVNDDNSVLLRLIDDFMIISTKRDTASRFMQTMHAGIGQFGVNVKLEKSRANFDLDIDGSKIPMPTDEAIFPYCGMAINTTTLDLAKDEERRQKCSKSLVTSSLGRC